MTKYKSSKILMAVFCLSGLVGGYAHSAPYFDETPEKPLPSKVNDKFMKRGHLKILAESSGTQEAAVHLNYCGESKVGERSAPGKCRQAVEETARSGVLSLPVGNYLVTYSGSLARRFVPVVQGMTTVLETKRIKIPGSAGGNKYHFFVDFTSSEMQTFELQYLWMTEDSEHILRHCRDARRVSQAARHACDAWKSGDDKALLGSFVKFDQQGRVSYAQFRKFHGRLDIAWSLPSHLWTGFGELDDTVSLFSGTYGVRIEDAATGLYQIQLGVRVD